MSWREMRRRLGVLSVAVVRLRLRAADLRDDADELPLASFMHEHFSTAAQRCEDKADEIAERYELGQVAA